MSLMDKLKKEHARLKDAESERGNFEKIDWYQPKEGENNLRFLKNKTNPEEVPFRRVLMHWLPIKKKDGGRATIPVRCPSELEDTCPMCKKFAVLQKAGDKEKAMGLRVTERYLYNVINYDLKKVQPYAAPLTVHNEVMAWIEEVDIFTRDWRLTKKKGKGIQVDYSVRPSMKDSAISEKMKPFLETMTDLNSLYNDNEKKKMLEYLGEEIGEEEEDDVPDLKDEDDDAAEKAAAAKAKAAKAKAAAVKKPEPEPEEDEDDGFAEAKPAKSKAKAKPADDEDETPIEVDGDDDLEAELKELGVT